VDVDTIRADFPILKREVNGYPLVYFDNAATSQKPVQVISAITDFYENHNANVGRAVHTLSQEATESQQNARKKVAHFINAQNSAEIIFLRGTTEAINLVAYSLGLHSLKKGDEILLSAMEHHSNIVPWQILKMEKNANLCYIGVDDEGRLRLDDYENFLETGNVRLIALSEMSNVLGTIFPLNEIIRIAHHMGIPVLVDAAQSVPHMPVDVQRSDCDFLAFSAHKMLGPTGVGILYVKREILEGMQPFIGGGDMIKEVHKQGAIYNDLPYRFEGGTSNIAGVIGFGAALDYLNMIGMDRVRDHEIDITKYALAALTDFKNVKLYGPRDAIDRGGVISFNIADIHPHDLATIMNERGIAIRSGHHCAQVLMERLDVSATSRASFYIYNTKEEVDIFIDALDDARRIFRV